MPKRLLVGRICLLLLASAPVLAEEKTPPLAGYEEGFFLRSADEKYKLKINANLQMRYEFRAIEGARNTNTVSIPRSRLIFTGNVFTPKLTFMVMPEMGDHDQTHTSTGTGQSVNVFLRDLWFNYAVTRWFQIKVGQFFLPRHRQAYTISPQQQFGEYPITACGDFTYTWDRGVDLHGSVSRLDYDATVTNGTGGNLTNVSRGIAFGTRLVYNIFGNYGYSEADVTDSQSPHWAVGGHLSFNNNDNYNKAASADPSPDYLLASFDTAFKYKGFSGEAEFMNLHNFEGDANHPAFTVQAGYFIVPKHLDVALQASRIFWEGPDNDQSEYVGGMSYYFRRHKIKVHATYSLLVDEDGNGQASNGFTGVANAQVDHRVRVLVGFAF